jgi:hypothetical protein
VSPAGVAGKDNRAGNPAEYLPDVSAQCVLAGRKIGFEGLRDLLQDRF